MQGHQREWDESRSPQWKYLLSKENRERRLAQRTEEQEQIKVKRVSKRKKLREERKKINKKGQKIIYSANPSNYGVWRNSDSKFRNENEKNNEKQGERTT